MKTLEQFARESKKSIRTVKAWIKNGLVNGAKYSDNKFEISDLARPPYTRASSRNAASIRKGIVIGCKRRLSVNSRIFKSLSDYEFSVYLSQCIDLDLIEKRDVNGVTYYYATAKTTELSESRIYQIVKGLTESVIGAAVGAATEKILSVSSNT